MPKHKTIGENPLDRLVVKGKGRRMRAVVADGPGNLGGALLKRGPAGRPQRRKSSPRPKGAWGWIKSLFGG